MQAVLQTENGWRRFDQAFTTISATELKDVLPALVEIERLVEEKQWHAVGYVSYDASPAFDPALESHPTAGFPLLSFSFFQDAKPVEFEPQHWQGEFSITPWTPSISKLEYEKAFGALKEYIRLGHAYQVNYTFPLNANFHGDSRALFGQLVRAQQPRYGAWISTPDWTICSVSPELFFTLNGNRLVSRPMKGTAPRGLTTLEDDRIGARLRRSEKDQAENIMIVDMLRNDMGRIAEPGSVKASPLFALERYPNVHQMTSTVRSRTSASVSEIFKALFPCASITGAPKVRATEIIRELEPQPRGVYTGAIGYLAPKRYAQFNVAIRTVVIRNKTGEAQFGSGSGVVWDSQAQSEYTECITKTSVLNRDLPPFKLLETMLWTPEDGWFLLDLHLKRLRDSARYFGFRFSAESIQKELSSMAGSFGSERQRVRLFASNDGQIELQSVAVPSNLPNPTTAKLATDPIDRQDPFIYHKTTRRLVYEKAAASQPGAELVLLWNREGEVTEATIANVAYSLNGKLYTPPVQCGVLSGVYRCWLLAQKKLRERVFPVSEISMVEKLFLLNSVRGMWEIQISK